MPAITLLSMLNEARKQEVYDIKRNIMTASFAHMAEDEQERVLEALSLPDDIADSILRADYDNPSTIKEAINGN